MGAGGSLSGDATALLERLVAFPTIAGEPNGELIGYLRELLAQARFEVVVVPSDSRPDGLNLHAVLGPPEEAGTLLAAHTDVVAVEGQSWSSDPFRLMRVEDRLYGRGTADMKGFIAAILATLPYASARPLRRPLHIALSCDEELGCRGVGSLLDRLAGLARPPAICIIGEPTVMRVADRHKGKVSFRVDVRGRTGHSSAAPQSVNAVSYAARLITSIDELGRALQAERDASFLVPHPTLSIGPIRGGVSTNIVPETCWFEFELRYLPGHDADEVLGQIFDRADSLQDEMRVTAEESVIELHRLSAYPPLAPASPPVALPFDAGAERIAVDFGTEAGLYHDRLGVPAVICGPGDMTQAHKADEYIEARAVAGGAAARQGDRGPASRAVELRDGPPPARAAQQRRSAAGAVLLGSDGQPRARAAGKTVSRRRRPGPRRARGGSPTVRPPRRKRRSRTARPRRRAGRRAVSRSGCDPRPSYDTEPRSPAGPSGSTAR